jgi:hypothetical protein
VPPQQSGGQIPAEVDGRLLARIKGDQVVLLVGGEHAVEGGGSVSQPLLAELRARR